MLFETLAVGPYQANCYIVAAEAGGPALVVDPGAQPDRILARVRELGLEVTHILLTHGHLDHIGAVTAMKEATRAAICIHPLDAPMLPDPRLNLSASSPRPVTALPADRLLEDGEEIPIGGLRLQVLHTPGHTPGGVCFLLPDRVLSGDTLFAGSIGRTDFPGGDMDQLLKSIRTKLLPLPDHLLVHPGHGDSTTIGDERAGNPFLS
ncbi:MAG: MBL fold metallo-hydrolase [Firmicutes bacterium]|nr:MBL fold metallo-hydrolase [Bacillota bacterium]